MDYLFNLHPMIFYPCTLTIIMGCLPVIFAISVMTYMLITGVVAEMLDIPDDDHDSLYKLMVLAMLLVPSLVVIYGLLINAVVSVTGYSTRSISQEV
jgi:hypothetical protein